MSREVTLKSELIMIIASKFSILGEIDHSHFGEINYVYYLHQHLKEYGLNFSRVIYGFNDV